MNFDFLKYLSCPDDFNPLAIVDNNIKCTYCNRKFKLHKDNILELLPINPYDPGNENVSTYRIYYNRVRSVKKYSGITNLQKIHHSFDKEEISKIPLSNNDIICEVGSGIKSLSLKYAEKSAIVFHTDLVYDDIITVREEAIKRNLNNMIFVVCNYFHLPFLPNLFDCVISTGNFGRHGYPHDKRLLEQISRITKKNGKIIIDFMTKLRNILDRNKEYDVDKNEIYLMMKNQNLKIISFEGIGVPPYFFYNRAILYKIFNILFKSFIPPARWLVKIKKL